MKKEQKRYPSNEKIITKPANITIVNGKSELIGIETKSFVSSTASDSQNVCNTLEAKGINFTPDLFISNPQLENIRRKEKPRKKHRRPKPFLSKQEGDSLDSFINKLRYGRNSNK